MESFKLLPVTLRLSWTSKAKDIFVSVFLILVGIGLALYRTWNGLEMPAGIGLCIFGGWYLYRTMKNICRGGTISEVSTQGILFFRDGKVEASIDWQAIHSIRLFYGNDTGDSSTPDAIKFYAHDGTTVLGSLIPEQIGWKSESLADALRELHKQYCPQ